MRGSLPWDDERPFRPVEQSFEKTMEASKKLDAHLSEAIKESEMTNKLVEFVDMVEDGLKELQTEVEELMPRFQSAMQKGKENMPRLRSHVQRAEEAVSKVEDFNRRMEGSNSEKK